MGGALRFVEIYADAHVAQGFNQAGGAHVFFGAAAKEEVVYFFVEDVGVGEYTVEGIFYVEAEDGAAETTDVRELVKIGQRDVKRLLATPR